MRRRGGTTTIALVAWVAGCTGEVGAPPLRPAGARAITCDTAEPGRAPIRLLTAEELDSTLAIVLGDTTRPATRLLPPSRIGGFSNNADVRIVSALDAEQYQAIAEDVAARAGEDLVRLLRCDPAREGEDPCAMRFVVEFGHRAYRRPLDEEERERLTALYASAKNQWGFRAAVETVLEVMLQSPHFLYRVERAPVDARAGDVVRLDGHTLATRLSFFLHGHAPDDALLAAAAAGELDTDEGLERRARAMLADARSVETIVHFFDEWMELAELGTLTRDPALYPGWTAEMPTLFREEAHRFVREVWTREEARWPVMLTADFRVVNSALARFAGLPEPPAGATWARVAVDPSLYAGVLTLSALTASRSKPHETSPIHRGMFVRAALLCGTVPPPPEEVEPIAPDPDPNLTVRQRLARHRENPACASCHHLMDPLGFPLEHFDPVGRLRTAEAGRPIDASGEIHLTDVDGAVVGARALADRLAPSAQVDQCIARQLFRFANGRTENPDVDRCSFETIDRRFAESGGDLRELVIAIVTSDAFVYRRVQAAEVRR